jgi:hypothetical protein
MLVGLVVASVLVLAVAPADAKVRRPSQVWDPGVAAIAHRVERLRGLQFRYPVRVDLVGDRVGSRSEVPIGESTVIARQLRHLQALGVVASNATAENLSSAARGAALGEYLPASQSISVYRSHMDWLTRVVIAHELTHALDDQHYHFTRHQPLVHSLGAEEAYRAAVEGDARRIESAYYASLPVASQRLASNAYERLRTKATSLSTALAGKLEWDAVLADAPYTLGQQLTRYAVKTGGEPNLRGLLTTAPVNDLVLLDPANGDGSNRIWLPVITPLHPGETPDGREAPGALEIYLLLASRISPDLAFLAADNSVGAGTTWFTRDGTTCAHTALRPRPDHVDDVIRAIDAYVNAAGPNASRQLTGSDVILTTCTGTQPLASGTIATAELVLAARSHALTAPIHTPSTRQCITNAVLSDTHYRDQLQHDPTPRQLGGADPAFASAIQQARTTCNTTPT